ncbi:MAG: sigma-54 dependent transcriptional regulator [Candidatus Poribacteria bacterium]|nr:sigma-54 dependent transcriptional regulator [Candidatus Poribacteria bacterium]
MKATLHKILVVDDEFHVRKTLTIILERAGYAVESVEDGAEAIEMLSTSIYDLVLCDLRMPRIDGMEVLHVLKQIQPDTPFIIITAYGTIENAVTAMQQGAYSYITKMYNTEEVLILVKKAIQQKRLIEENKHFKRQLNQEYSFDNIIGVSPPIKAVFSRLRKVIDTESTVLITGESGTGKELIARAIHYNSPRRESPMITINCSSIPAELLESELFGHAKGAFTGATGVKKGLFEEASGSTLFLDEIGELPPALQVKLLRAIQEGEIRRVGDNQPIEVDLRIIAATNRDLEKAVEQGEFREDFYYRLNVVSIHLPRLRHRREDIPLLAKHFLAKFTETHNRSIRMIAPDAMEALMNYSWPGNIRELQNAIEQAVVMCDSEIIQPEDLPDKVHFSDAKVHVIIPENQFDLKGLLNEVLEQTESQLINRALELTEGNRTKAAELLGISRRGLLYKLKEEPTE